MVNAASKRCSYRDCNKHPSYGLAGSKRAERCFSHAEDGMVNVVSKRCSYRGCDKLPSSGKTGRNKMEPCAVHAEVEW